MTRRDVEQIKKWYRDIPKVVQLCDFVLSEFPFPIEPSPMNEPTGEKEFMDEWKSNFQGWGTNRREEG